MNIEYYKTFLNLAMTENFSKTAEHMNIVQSTVSSRINELEKYLNTKLFHRTKRNVEITIAGKLLIPYARKLVSIENEGKTHLQSATEIKDRLVVTVPSSVYREKLSPVISYFYNTFPEYSLDVRTHKTNNQLEMLLDNDADIGFISRIPNTNKLEVIKYLDYSWILVGRGDDSCESIVDPCSLVKMNIAYNHLNTEYNEWLFDALPRNFGTRININNTNILIDFVKKGNGYAFLPTYAIESELSNGIFKEIKIKNTPHNKFSIYIAINKKRKNSIIVEKFLSLIPELDEFKYNI